MENLSSQPPTQKRLLPLLIVVVLSLLAPSPAFTQESPELDVSEDLETGIIATQEQRAEIYLEKEEWNKLGALAKKWVRDYPGESDAWHYLGRAQQGAGKVREATDSFLRAWDLSDKKDYRIIEDIGDSYAKIKHWEKADEAYRTATTIRPRRALLWYKLANTALHRIYEGSAQNSAEVLKKTLTFGEYVNDYSLWMKYARILDVLNNDIEEQYFAYRHVVRLKADDLNAWERLYEIETERGNEGETAKIVDILFRLDSQNPFANLHYGKLALKNNFPQKARDFFAIGLKHKHVSPKQRSDIYMSLGDLEIKPHRALPYYRDAAIHNPTNIGAWEQVIVMLKGMNRRRDAAKIYTALLAIERKIKKQAELFPVDTAPLQSIK